MTAEVNEAKKTPPAIEEADEDGALHPVVLQIVWTVYFPAGALFNEEATLAQLAAAVVVTPLSVSSVNIVPGDCTSRETTARIGAGAGI